MQQTTQTTANKAVLPTKSRQWQTFGDKFTTCEFNWLLTINSEHIDAAIKMLCKKYAADELGSIVKISVSGNQYINEYKSHVVMFYFNTDADTNGKLIIGLLEDIIVNKQIHCKDKAKNVTATIEIKEKYKPKEIVKQVFDKTKYTLDFTDVEDNELPSDENLLSD